MIPTTIPTAVHLIVKILALLGLTIYAVFAAVMVRQEHLMADVLEEGFEPVLRILTLLHLGAALILLAFAFIVL